MSKDYDEFLRLVGERRHTDWHRHAFGPSCGRADAARTLSRRMRAVGADLLDELRPIVGASLDGVIIWVSVELTAFLCARLRDAVFPDDGGDRARMIADVREAVVNDLEVSLMGPPSTRGRQLLRGPFDRAFGSADASSSRGVAETILYAAATNSPSSHTDELRDELSAVLELAAGTMLDMDHFRRFIEPVPARALMSRYTSEADLGIDDRPGAILGEAGTPSWTTRISALKARAFAAVGLTSIDADTPGAFAALLCDVAGHEVGTLQKLWKTECPRKGPWLAAEYLAFLWSYMCVVQLGLPGRLDADFSFTVADRIEQRFLRACFADDDPEESGRDGYFGDLAMRRFVRYFGPNDCAAVPVRGDPFFSRTAEWLVRGVLVLDPVRYGYTEVALATAGHLAATAEALIQTAPFRGILRGIAESRGG